MTETCPLAVPKRQRRYARKDVTNGRNEINEDVTNGRNEINEDVTNGR
jgi:hypothetical protein